MGEDDGPGPGFGCQDFDDTAGIREHHVGGGLVIAFGELAEDGGAGATGDRWRLCHRGVEARGNPYSTIAHMGNR